MQRIFLHGLGQGPSSWDGTLRYLDGPALCPDLFSLPRRGEFGYQALYQAFCAYCAAVSGPVQLCGLSLGGVLALHYAAEHPENVSSLALIGAQYAMPKRLLQFQDLLFRWAPAGVFQGAGLAREEMRTLCRSMADLDFGPKLREIAAPALVVCGARDRANRRSSVQLQTLLPNARLVLLPGSGHEVNREAPDQLGPLLRDFFGEF